MNNSACDDVLIVKGAHSFLLVAPVRENFALCLETRDNEYVQGVHAGDVVVVSAPEDGPVEPALMILELVRTYHLPVIVLPRNHPGSKRIPYVISVAPEIQTSCSVVRGTHPEQHLICSSDELAGLTIRMTREGITLFPLADTFTLEKIQSAGIAHFSPESSSLNESHKKPT
ncbi:MAG: alpha/beta hydrolase [Methanoregula sp.]|uniref:alpha/beta hydrolase n=1 Tax=Methanoregula sp. TaxID=2052170 RepID=UPI003BAFE087